MVKNAKKVKLPEFYFTFQVLWLRLTGIEVLKRSEGIPYRIYSTLALLFALIYVFVEWSELAFHKDFDTIGLVICYILNHTLAMVRVTVIYRNRKEIGDLLRSFHQGYYKPDKTRGGEFEEECINKILGQTHFQMAYYGRFFVISLTSAFLGSLKVRFTEVSKYWRLPFGPMSIVDINKTPNFELACTYQTVAVVLVCTWVYICDCTVISIIAQTTAQLKILENCVRNYKSKGGKMQTEAERNLVSQTLHDTIKHHLSLLETVDQVEHLCSYLVLCVFVGNLIVLCMMMYVTSMTPVGSFEFINYLLYGTSVAVQILLYCWWGNEMTLANNALALGVFESYNPDDPLNYAKSLKLMLVKAQKPLFFTVGKFVPLSLETYKAIMKGSFSYFTVIRQVNTK